MPLLTRQVYRRALLLISPLNLGTICQEQLDDLFVIVMSSEVQGCTLLVAICIHIALTITDQDCSAFQVAVVGGMMQGSPPV